MSQIKTVRAYTQKIDSKTMQDLDSLFISYGSCLDFFYRRFCGIKSMTAVQSWRKLRNQIRAEQAEIKNARKNSPDSTLAHLKLLPEQFHFQGRHWVEALQQCCMNLNSMWSNIGALLKKQVTANDNLTKYEKHYLYYVLSARPIWQAILLHQGEYYKTSKKSAYFKLKAELTDKELHRCHNYLRRITRKHKLYPKVTNNKCMLYDDMMYSIKAKDEKELLGIMTSKRGKKLWLVLTSPYCYSKQGNIQLILDRIKKRIEVHKSIKARTHDIDKKVKKLGTDKGLYNLLSCSDGNEYGLSFSTIAGKEASRITKRNSQRNHFIQLHKHLRLEKERLTASLPQKVHNNSQLKKQKHIYALTNKLKHLEKENLGSNLYHQQHNKAVDHMKSLIGLAVRTMLLTERPQVLAKEDLTFTKDKSKKAKNRYLAKVRNKLNSWVKGILNDRLEYQSLSYGVIDQDVNPAYTSQYCPECGAHFQERTGAHHEIALCPNCGKMNANTAAGKNILARLHDPEITLYTPYKEVKKILDQRYKEKATAKLAVAR